MSAAAAKRCNIARLIDTRWAGIAKGVGVQRIIGRIHMCTIQIENNFLASSFSVLEQQPMDMLLGKFFKFRGIFYFIFNLRSRHAQKTSMLDRFEK